MPGHVRAYLRGLGFRLPLEEMEGHIAAWDGWMRAVGDFYDYRDTDGFGRVYEVHRRSVMPAMRVCREWGVAAFGREDAGGLRRAGLHRVAGAVLFRLRVLGPGAGDGGARVRAEDRDLRRLAGRGAVRVRHYDARMVVPRACPSAPSSS